MLTHETLAAWDCAHYWHAFTQMAEYRPLIIERAQGVWLYDTQGNRYLDGISSMWCTLHGHCHPVIDEAIRTQLDKVAHATSLGVATPPAIQLAKRLADLAPGTLNHVFFGSDGSSAVEAALKIAFQYWRQCDNPEPAKSRFVALCEAYHGDTIGSASVGGIARFTAVFEPLLFDVFRLPIPDKDRLPSGADAEEYLAQLEQLLASHHHEIAAVVLEPRIQAAAGMIFHPPGYLRGVRALTRKYDVLMIVDEIVTGCGRTGRLFACDHEEVVPDLLCLGKSLTGGYLPLSVAIATTEIYKAFLGNFESGRTFCHGHTYGGNPLAAAAALATLDVLLSDQVQDHLAQRIGQLSQILARLAELRQVAQTRQLGMIAAVELTPDGDPLRRYPPEDRVGHAVCGEALERGVWVRPLGNTLVVLPPISISAEELEFFGTALKDSIVAATQRLETVSDPTR